MRLKLKEFSLLSILEIINTKCWIPIYNTDRLHKWCSFLVCMCVCVCDREKDREWWKEWLYANFVQKKTLEY